MRSVAFGAQFTIQNLNMRQSRELADEFEKLSHQKVVVGSNGLGQPVIQTGDNALMAMAASKLNVPQVSWNVVG